MYGLVDIIYELYGIGIIDKGKKMDCLKMIDF